MIKKKKDLLSKPAKQVDFRRKFDIPNLSQKDRKEMREIGLKTISEGQLCVIVNGAGTGDMLSKGVPKMAFKPKWELDCTLIEYLLNKLRVIGDVAVKAHGKNFKGNRQPIMVLLMANEYQIEDVEQFLVKNKYFFYTGIICLSQVKTHNLGLFC